MKDIDHADLWRAVAVQLLTMVVLGGVFLTVLVIARM